MKKLLNLAFITVLSTVAVTQSVANTISTEGKLTLSYSDGRKATTGVDKVNALSSAHYLYQKQQPRYWKLQRLERSRKLKVKS